MSGDATGEIRDNVARSRYELDVDGEVAFVEYVRAPGVIRFTHAEVPPAVEGRGIGSRLARHVLETARRDGVHIVPQCPFIADYLRRHPDLAN